MIPIKNMIALEIKSAVRNKRLIELFSALSLLIGINVVLPWLLYYDIFFTKENKLYVSLQATGWCMLVLSITYSSLSFNWQGSYFPVLVKAYNGVKQVFATNLIYPLLINCITFIVIYPFYYFLFREVSYWIITFFLFNVGVLFPSVFAISVIYNNQTIDLHKSRYLNFQGIRFANVIAILIPILLLFILVGISKYLLNSYHILPNYFSIAGILISICSVRWLKNYFIKNIIKTINY